VAAVGGQQAAAWSQGAAGVAMSTTAVATLLVKDHISMVAAVAEAPEGYAGRRVAAGRGGYRY
jgi:hypothetical protein